MSLISAIKYQDVVYFGADSQLTDSVSKANNLCIGNLKIEKIGENILLAGAGNARILQIFKKDDEILEVLTAKPLDKKYLLKKFIPLTIRVLSDYDLLSEFNDETSGFDGQLIIAQKDKLFLIENSFKVYCVDKFVTIGSGSDYILSSLIHIDYTNNIENQMLEALKIGAKFDPSVSGPYFFSNTRDLKFEMKE